MGNDYIELTQMVAAPQPVRIDHESIRDLPDMPERFVVMCDNYGEPMILAARGVKVINVTGEIFDPYPDDIQEVEKVRADARIALAALMVGEPIEGVDADQMKQELVHTLTEALPELEAELKDEGDDEEEDDPFETRW